MIKGDDNDKRNKTPTKANEKMDKDTRLKVISGS